MFITDSSIYDRKSKFRITKHEAVRQPCLCFKDSYKGFSDSLAIYQKKLCYRYLVIIPQGRCSKKCIEV